MSSPRLDAGEFRSSFEGLGDGGRPERVDGEPFHPDPCLVRVALDQSPHVLSIKVLVCILRDVIPDRSEETGKLVCALFRVLFLRKP